jgi:hypothetical protein
MFKHKIAFLPEKKPEIVSPQWLDWLKGLGYNGIYLETDPFLPARGVGMTQFQTHYRGISLFDVAWGEERGRLREWIHRACELAHDRDMKVYLALWEPRLPAEAWGLIPHEWHGVGSYDRAPWNSIAWCMSHPPAIAAFERMATEAFSAIKNIDGLKIGTHDNEAFLCTDDCPRCKGRGRDALTAQALQSILNAAKASGIDRNDFDYVLYTWWWTPEELQKAADIYKDKRITVLGRSSQGIEQTHRGKVLGTVFDQSLGARGTGEGFKQQLAMGQERKWDVADMTPFGHCFEYFWQPYTPAPNLVAEKIISLREQGSSGWFDYDCGGIYPGINAEIIRQDHLKQVRQPVQLVAETLRRLYSSNEIPAAQAAYANAEAALALRPIAYNAPDSSNMSGRAMFELAIALPFQSSDFSGLDHGHRLFWFAPQNFMTRGGIFRLLDMLAECHRAWKVASDLIQPLKGHGEWPRDLEWEKTVFRAHALVSGSAWRYALVANMRLERGRGTDAAAEREKLLTIYQDEMTAVQEFAGLWRKDRRLMMNAFFREHAMLQSMVPWVPIDRDDPFITKIDHTRCMIDRLRTGVLDAVPEWTR